jgi:putative membrane protein
MQLEERTVGDVTVIKVTGDITLSSGGDVLLKDKVQSLLQQGKKKLLLDLGSVAYVDSGGPGSVGTVQRHRLEERRRVEAVEHDQASQRSAGVDQAGHHLRLARERGRGAQELFVGDAMHVLLRLLINAAALWVATQLVSGITYTGDGVSLLGVALVFGVLNVLIKPVLFLLSLPFVILTLGLFTLVLNALMLLLTASASDALGLGFSVAGFAAGSQRSARRHHRELWAVALRLRRRLVEAQGDAALTPGLRVSGPRASTGVSRWTTAGFRRRTRTRRAAARRRCGW